MSWANNALDVINHDMLTQAPAATSRKPHAPHVTDVQRAVVKDPDVIGGQVLQHTAIPLPDQLTPAADVALEVDAVATRHRRRRHLTSARQVHHRHI